MATSRDSGQVAVIGGGIAGMAVAYYLGKAGISVDLYEAEPQIGGLARSFNFDGLTIERYYHFICLTDYELIELGQELGIHDMLRWNKTRTSYYYMGQNYPFTTPLDLLRFSPIRFSSRLKMGLKTLQWDLIKDWPRLDDLSAKEWLISSFGAQTYDVVWSPLLTMKFGELYEKVSAAWIWHRVHRVAKSRKSIFHQQVMGYYEGGTDLIFKSLEKKIYNRNGKINLATPVEKILVDEKAKIKGISVKGKDIEYEAVVSTCPLPQVAGMLPDDQLEFKTNILRVPYIGVICLALWLDRSLIDVFWCNVHDDKIPFNGIIEMSRLNPDTGRGGALVYVPMYLPLNSPMFSYSDERLVREFTDIMHLISPDNPKISVKASRVFRSTYAQALCSVGFRHLLQPHQTPIDGYFLIDSTQLYPSDRTLSGTVGLARKVVELLSRKVQGGNDGA